MLSFIMLCMTVGDHEFSINCLTKFSASCNDMAILNSCSQLELQATSIVGYLGKGFGFLHDALIYTIGRETVESIFFFQKDLLRNYIHTFWESHIIKILISCC